MTNASRLFVTIAVFALVLPAFAQSPSTTALPTISFTFDHPDLPVTHYQIDIAADGKAHYQSQIRGQKKGTTEDGISRDFVLSADTRDSIFDLVKKADNLVGNFDYARHKIAFSGTKTIVYTDATGSHTAKFNWSENESVMKLADLFPRHFRHAGRRTSPAAAAPIRPARSQRRAGQDGKTGRFRLAARDQPDFARAERDCQ